MKNKILTFTKTAIAVLAIVGAATGCSPTDPTDPNTTVPTEEPTSTPTVEPNYYFETYKNPLIPRGGTGQKYMAEAPDPSIVRGDDGYWYAVTTGNGGGKMFRSADCCSWKVHLERVIPRPTWGDNGGDTPNVWAPDLIKIQDKWIYYYSLSGWGNPIGVGYAVADQVEGPYEDKGKLVTCAELGLDNAIEVAKKNDLALYEQGKILFVQATEDVKTSTYLTFDMSRYFEAGSYNVEVKTLAGLGLPGVEEGAYLLNARAEAKEVFKKFTDTEFVLSDNGELKLELSYVNDGWVYTYAEKYEITIRKHL